MNPAFNNRVLAFAFPDVKLYMLIPRLYWSRPRPVSEATVLVLPVQRFFSYCKFSKLCIHWAAGRTGLAGCWSLLLDEALCPSDCFRLPFWWSQSSLWSACSLVQCALQAIPSSCCFPSGIYFLMYLHKSLIHIFPHCREVQYCKLWILPI